MATDMVNEVVFIKMSSSIQQLQLSTKIQPKPSPLNELERIRRHQTGVKCGVETFHDPSGGVSHNSTGLQEKPLGARDSLQNKVPWEPAPCVLLIKQRDGPGSDGTFYVFIFGLLHV